MTRTGYITHRSTLLCLTALALAAAGCGGSSRHAAAPAAPTTSTAALHPTTPAKSAPCPSPAHLQHALAVAHRDLAAIRRAAAPVKHSTLMGTPRLQQTTSDFIDHVDGANLGLLTKNHLLSLGVSAVAGTCDQCFQWLEADRPMVALQYGPSGQCTQ